MMYSSVSLLRDRFCQRPRSTYRPLEPRPEAFMVQCRYIEAYVIGSSATEAIVVKLGSTPNVWQPATRQRHGEA